jgi:predicted Rossmann fold nucleotide-binding protein DprA/Smf involved in DNA uptake
MSELIARARLFAAIEGGSSFWSREIFSNGASYVLDRALNGAYDPIKYARTIEKIKTSNADELFQSISEAGAIFLTPEDSTWPQSVTDLAAPPIALVVKGDPKLLTGNSLAIVGTRNPTQYGVRIAQDFAAGFVDRDWAIISGGAYGIDAAARNSGGNCSRH